MNKTTHITMKLQQSHKIEGNCVTCPVCGSDDTQRDDIEGGNDRFSMWESMSCHECQSTWTNIWNFGGWMNIDDCTGDDGE